MDFKQLLQLAGDNSAFAKKKLDRLEHSGSNAPNVSSSAVEKYLEKQKKLREKQKAEEEEARRKRIKARLEASLGKKKVVKQIKKEVVLKNEKLDDKNELKFKVHDGYKTKEKKKSEGNGVSMSSSRKSDDKDDKIKVKTENRQNKHVVDHRKEKDRTIINHTHNKKPSSKPSSSSNSTALSFADLMKVAKDNAAGIKKPDTKLKRALPVPNKEEAFDPDRHLRLKKRKEEPLRNHTTDSSKHSLPSKNKSMHQDERHSYKNHNERSSHNHKQKILNSENRYTKEANSVHKNNVPNVPIKRGVITETISSTKTMLPAKKITNTFKQIKSSGGIAAQNRGRRDKRSVQDIEDEFAKEARLLEKKRRLFELRRIHGNNFEEEDLIDDYDIDEEDEDEDDFIDDSEYAGDVSKHIRSIYGYDRRMYSDSEDDVDNMESSYSQIAKEEARSARIAKIEDAYEKMKEEEEIQRQKIKLKKKLKK